MTIYYAQPYDISATGFNFEDVETYEAKIGSTSNDYGQPVEEFEIQFIDGERIDCDLAKAWGINQANIQRFLEVLDEWEDCEKLRFIIAVGEAGYDFSPDSIDPDDFDVDIYFLDSMKALAEQFVDEGLYGEIPECLTYYIDLEAIARDLAIDYTEVEIAGKRPIYRCG